LGTRRAGQPLSHSPAAWSLADRSCKAHAVGQALADAVAAGAWHARGAGGDGGAAGAALAAAAVARLLPDLTLPDPSVQQQQPRRASNRRASRDRASRDRAANPPPPPLWLALTLAAGVLPHAPMATRLAAAMGLAVLSKCEVQFVCATLIFCVRSLACLTAKNALPRLLWAHVFRVFFAAASLA
jgi:hypothetical protein